MRLPLKLALTILLSGILPLGILGGILFQSMTRYFKEIRHEQMLSLADQVGQEVGRLVMGSYQSILLLSKNPLIREQNLAFEELNETLLRTQQVHPVIKDLTLLDTEGQVLASALHSYKKSWGATSWFHSALQGKRLHFDANSSPDPSDIIISASVPIQDKNGEVVRILIGHLDMNPINAIVTSVNLGSVGKFLIVDSQGIIVASSDPAQLFKPLANEKLRQYLELDREGVMEIIDNDEHLAACLPLTIVSNNQPSLDWTVVHMLPTNFAYKHIRSVHSWLLLAIALSLTITLLLSSLLARTVRRRLDTLTLSTRQLGSGKFDVEFPIQGRDEIGELAEAIKGAGRQLSEYHSRLKEYQEGLEKRIIQRTSELQNTNEDLRLEIEERRRMEERLTHMSFHDGLTNLPNRALFMDRLRRAVERSKRKPSFQFAVLFLDIDRFKVINDSLGHSTGDQVIVQAAKIILECVRAMDTVSRVGGDEFAILLEELNQPEEALTIAERIRTYLSKPLMLHNQEVRATASIGVVYGSMESQSAEMTLRDADIAMYEAKRLGRDRSQIFNQKMREEATHVFKLEHDLRRGLLNKEFLLYYQPVLDIKDKNVKAVEALIRWNHPERGLLYPAEFISQAESSGLIEPIGLQVLELAIKQYSRWQQILGKPLEIGLSVNLSAKQLQPKLAEDVQLLLKKYRFPASSLVLEITESVVMENAAQAQQLLLALNAMNVKLAIDDFGMGYSSLGYLHQFPIDILKVDRAFVQRMLEAPSQKQIVKTIIQMAHGLELSVVAEGVERKEQLEALHSMECDFGQGYLFSRPLPPEQAQEYIFNNLYNSSSSTSNIDI